MPDSISGEDIKKKKRRRRKKKVLPVEPLKVTEVVAPLDTNERIAVTSEDNKEDNKKNGLINQEIFPVDISHIPATSNPLGIDDIAGYIQSMKKKSSNPLTIHTPNELIAFDGTDIKKLPNLYAIVPHAKGDHKLVYTRELAPKNLRDDDKSRTKGSVYIKQGRPIYDVFVDFKRHPILKTRNGDHMDVRIIDSPKDLEQQIASIKQSEGGGLYFGSVLVLEKKEGALVDDTFGLPEQSTMQEEKVIDPVIIQEINPEINSGDDSEPQKDELHMLEEDNHQTLPGAPEEFKNSYNDKSSGDEVIQVSETSKDQEILQEEKSIYRQEPSPYELNDDHESEEETFQQDSEKEEVLPDVLKEHDIPQEIVQENQVGTEDFIFPDNISTDNLLVSDIDIPDITDENIEEVKETLDKDDIIPIELNINNQDGFDAMNSQEYESSQKANEEASDHLGSEALLDKSGIIGQEQQQYNDEFWDSPSSSEELQTVSESEQEQQSFSVEPVIDVVTHEDNAKPLEGEEVIPEVGTVQNTEQGVVIATQEPVLQPPAIDISDIVLDAPEEIGATNGTIQSGILDTFKVGVDSVFHTHLHDVAHERELQVSTDIALGEKKKELTMTAGQVSEESIQQLEALTNPSNGNGTTLKEQVSKKTKKILLVIAEILLPLLLIGLAYGVYKIMFSATDINPTQQEQLKKDQVLEKSKIGQENQDEIVIPSIEKYNEQQKTMTGANEEDKQNLGNSNVSDPSTNLGSQYTSQELVALLRQYIKETEGLLSQSMYNSHAGAAKILRIAQQKSSFMLNKLETTGEMPSLEEVEHAIKRIETYIKQAKETVLSNNSL